MVIIRINLNKAMVVSYALGVALLLIILAVNVLPLVYYVRGVIPAVITGGLFGFAYLAYLAGLVKESKIKGLF